MKESTSRPDKLIDRLQNAVVGTLAEIERLPSSDAYASSAAEAWSVAQILAHLIEMLPYWAEQARAVAARAEDGAPFGRTHDDPERIAAVRDHARDDVRELATGVRTSLNRAVATLRAIPDKDWHRTGRHARRGEMSVTQIVEQFLSEHAEEHALQFRVAVAEQHTMEPR